jgi:hypothetical protein
VRLSIADHEANCIVEVTNDDVAFQGQRRIKSEFWHYSYSVAIGTDLILWASWRTYSDHVVSRQRPSNPFQLELTDWLDLHGIFDLHQHSRADEDLPRPGFIAEARGDVGNSPDCGIVKSALKADGA